jgi:transposase
MRPFLVALIARQPDLTLDKIVVAMHKRRIAGSRSAVWRFFQRHKISFKKSLRAAEQERADVARARKSRGHCIELCDRIRGTRSAFD